MFINSRKITAKKIEWKNQEGSVTIEYALCIPVVIVLLFLILSFVNYSVLCFKCQNATSAIALYLSESGEADDPENSGQSDISKLHILVDGNFGKDKPDIKITNNGEFFEVDLEIAAPNSFSNLVFPKIHSHLVGHRQL